MAYRSLFQPTQNSPDAEAKIKAIVKSEKFGVLEYTPEWQKRQLENSLNTMEKEFQPENPEVMDFSRMMDAEKGDKLFENANKQRQLIVDWYQRFLRECGQEYAAV